MKALVIGANGFAGKYMCEDLLNNGYEVIKTDVAVNENVIKLDIMDYNAVFKLIQDKKPDVIFNLAGAASVSKSFIYPQLTMQLNIMGSINILEAVKKVSKDIKVLLIGSSDQYGTAKIKDTFVSEDSPQNPISPYAISKRCQEDIGKTYANIYKMNIYMTRSFNHIGVGQQLGFVVTDFANGISEIEKGNCKVLCVGNTNSIRNFTDVRDTVRAYRLITERGVSGRVYNVGSENSYSIQEILDILIGMSNVSITVEYNNEKMRVFDIHSPHCDSTRIRVDTGWKPKYSIENTLKEILDYYRK